MNCLISPPRTWPRRSDTPLRRSGSGSFRCGRPREIPDRQQHLAKVAAGLAEAGHDAVHVRDYDLRDASDPMVLDRARAEGRVLVSADTDFGALLAREHADTPSILLIRRLVGRRAVDQVAVLLANLDTVAEDLTAGAVVVLTDEWIRVRRLPILPR